VHPLLKQLIRLREEFLAEHSKELLMSMLLAMQLMLLWVQNAPQSKEESMLLVKRLKKPLKNFTILSNKDTDTDMLRKRRKTTHMLTHTPSKKKSRNSSTHSML
jgi:predicted MPP superfamily phosphohydrolase